MTPVTYDAYALNREQKKPLATNSMITQCRDQIHALAKKEGHDPLFWATCHFGLVAMTEDGPSPLSPFIVRYVIVARLDEQDA